MRAIAQAHGCSARAVPAGGRSACAAAAAGRSKAASPGSIPCRSSPHASLRLHVRAAAAEDGAAAAGTAVADTPAPIPTRLNTIPHERTTRQHFYREATTAIKRAIDAGETRVLARWACRPAVVHACMSV